MGRAAAALVFEAGDGLKAEISGTNTVVFSIDTDSELYANLKGDKGDKGNTGTTGPQGPQGETGPAGADGTGITKAEVNAAGAYEVALAAAPETQRLTVADSVTVAGSTEINASGIRSNAVRVNTASGEVVINNEGVSMGGNRISNVAAGTAPTDAATVGQLNDATDNLYRAYSELSDEIEYLGAETAALAGLKPIQYDPLEPTQIMAAVGAYRGTAAVAVGVAHYARENLMFHIGASYGGSSHSVLANAGVTFRVGAKKVGIPERYKAGPISATYVMQDEITALKAENEKLKASNEELCPGYEELKEQVRKLMENSGKN